MAVETTLLKLFYLSKTTVNFRKQLTKVPTRQWLQSEIFQKVETPEGKFPFGILGRWSSILRIRAHKSPDRI